MWSTIYTNSKRNKGAKKQIRSCSLRECGMQIMNDESQNSYMNSMCHQKTSKLQRQTLSDELFPITSKPRRARTNPLPIPAPKKKLNLSSIVSSLDSDDDSSSSSSSFSSSPSDNGDDDDYINYNKNEIHNKNNSKNKNNNKGIFQGMRLKFSLSDESLLVCKSSKNSDGDFNSGNAVWQRNANWPKTNKNAVWQRNTDKNGPHRYSRSSSMNMLGGFSSSTNQGNNRSVSLDLTTSSISHNTAALYSSNFQRGGRNRRASLDLNTSCDNQNASILLSTKWQHVGDRNRRASLDLNTSSCHNADTLSSVNLQRVYGNNRRASLDLNASSSVHNDSTFSSTNWQFVGGNNRRASLDSKASFCHNDIVLSSSNWQRVGGNNSHASLDLKASSSDHTDTMLSSTNWQRIGGNNRRASLDSKASFCHNDIVLSSSNWQRVGGNNSHTSLDLKASSSDHSAAVRSSTIFQSVGSSNRRASLDLKPSSSGCTVANLLPTDFQNVGRYNRRSSLDSTASDANRSTASSSSILTKIATNGEAPKSPTNRNLNSKTTFHIIDDLFDDDGSEEGSNTYDALLHNNKGVMATTKIRNTRKKTITDNKSLQLQFPNEQRKQHPQRQELCDDEDDDDEDHNGSDMIFGRGNNNRPAFLFQESNGQRSTAVIADKKAKNAFGPVEQSSFDDSCSFSVFSFDEDSVCTFSEFENGETGFTGKHDMFDSSSSSSTSSSSDSSDDKDVNFDHSNNSHTISTNSDDENVFCEILPGDNLNELFLEYNYDVHGIQLKQEDLELQNEDGQEGIRDKETTSSYMIKGNESNVNNNEEVSIEDKEDEIIKDQQNTSLCDHSSAELLDAFKDLPTQEISVVIIQKQFDEIKKQMKAHGLVTNLGLFQISRGVVATKLIDVVSKELSRVSI